jgi:hypothetical protein
MLLLILMNVRYKTGIVYEEAVPSAQWLNILFVVIVLATLLPGIWMLSLPTDRLDAYIMFVTAAFLAALFYFIMPRRIQIYEDRIRIALGGPFGINIPFSQIASVKAGMSLSSHVYAMKFATSSRTAVEILRKRGGAVVFSTRNRDMFLEQLNQAMQVYNRANPNPER